MRWKALLAVILCATSLTAVASAGDLTLDELLARNYETLGGLKAIKDVQSARFTGTMAMMGMEAPVTLEFLRPNRVRTDFTIQGVTGTRAYDGERGWEIMPFMGKTEPTEMSKDDLKDLIERADIDGPFVDWKEKGHQVELIGREDVEGTDAYKVKLVNKNGDVSYHYFEAEHCLEFMVEGTRVIQGNETKYTTLIGDYKQVGDLVVPHSFESSYGDATQTITLTKVEYNVEVDPDRFVMPVPAEAGASDGN